MGFVWLGLKKRGENIKIIIIEHGNVGDEIEIDFTSVKIR